MLRSNTNKNFDGYAMAKKLGIKIRKILFKSGNLFYISLNLSHGLIIRYFPRIRRCVNCVIALECMDLPHLESKST